MGVSVTLGMALVVPDGIALVADTWTARSHDVELHDPVEVGLGGSLGS